MYIDYNFCMETDKIFNILGNHTIAIIKGKECYETLQTSCRKIFSDVNKLVETGVLRVDEETEVAIEMYLGGDYKVL